MYILDMVFSNLEHKILKIFCSYRYTLCRVLEMSRSNKYLDNWGSYHYLGIVLWHILHRLWYLLMSIWCMLIDTLDTILHLWEYSHTHIMSKYWNRNNSYNCLHNFHTHHWQLCTFPRRDSIHQMSRRDNWKHHKADNYFRLSNIACSKKCTHLSLDLHKIYMIKNKYDIIHYYNNN